MEGNFLHQLIFGSYNKKCKPNQTLFDWLTRDEKRVQSYMSHPHYGFVCSNGFYYDLLTALKNLHDDSMKNISKKLPIFLISGEKDPVGNYGKGIRYLVNRYKKVGIEDVSFQLIPKARHEVLHELERDQHIKDIINWLHSHL
jgi:alpha-beta hydrolase superfamily lysophospholipase